jgi:hypothetical protein
LVSSLAMYRAGLGLCTRPAMGTSKFPVNQARGEPWTPPFKVAAPRPAARAWHGVVWPGRAERVDDDVVFFPTASLSDLGFRVLGPWSWV